jgi:hypothetical protein
MNNNSNNFKNNLNKKCLGIFLINNFEKNFDGKKIKNTDSKDRMNDDYTISRNDSDYQYDFDRKVLVDLELDSLLSAEIFETLIHRYPYTEQYHYNDINYDDNFNFNDDYSGTYNDNDGYGIKDCSYYNSDDDNVRRFDNMNKNDDLDTGDLIRLQLGCSMKHCVKLVSIYVNMFKFICRHVFTCVLLTIYTGSNSK